MGAADSFYKVIEDAVKKISSVKTSEDLFVIIDAIRDLPQTEKAAYALQIKDIYKLVPYYLLASTPTERLHHCFALEKSYKSQISILLHNIMYKLDHDLVYISTPREQVYSPFVVEKHEQENQSLSVPSIEIKLIEGPKSSSDVVKESNNTNTTTTLEIKADPIVIKAAIELKIKLLQII